ncbi:hypothetical protein QBC40DRAFT_331203 [Triangularia verruculosa]|uniref:F-box domain-containing protein n=1 Tax=Triangularia verruculosa TaxID=2587418 RepID=A0AAN7ARK7_9PEZI|nr:hypothetical protein QBC40DRAFT_331203 [Triangularia verruculosa]
MGRGMKVIPTRSWTSSSSVSKNNHLIHTGVRHLGAAVKQEALLNARLVCRQWDALATKHLFRRIALMHNSNDPTFAKWNQIVSSPIVQSAAGEVEIYSIRPPGIHASCGGYGLERDDDIWERWGDGEWPEFLSAINGIAGLPNLGAVKIVFSQGCEGSDEKGDRWEIVENFWTRMHTIENVFIAILQRKALASAKDSSRSGITPITSLTIENLQNRRFEDFDDDFLSTDIFRSVVEDITELRLQVTHEYTEYGPDYDIYMRERHEFEPWLQKELLPCFASRLTSLHISFLENWGVAPGYFDGKGLHFPNLKSLTLGEYVVGHHDQFEWVLAHTTLETLCLDRCVIVSYLHYNDDDIRRWGNIPTHDWKKVSGDERLYSFSGTWEQVFDRIRVGLHNLVQFRMRNVVDQHSKLRTPDELGCRLTAERYVTFSSGICPSPWLETKPDGTMEWPELPRENGGDYLKYPGVNRAKETQEGDMKAFKERVSAVKIELR